MKIALNQMNTVVGDIDYNLSKIKNALKNTPPDTDLLLFPELVLTGYIPKDLLCQNWFIQKILKAQDILNQLSKQYHYFAFLIGTPTTHQNNQDKGLYNSARLFYRGQCIFEQHKKRLPNYDVFEENRYFDSGTHHKIFPFKNENIGITICEDIWPSSKKNSKQQSLPIDELKDEKMSLLINISASPFEMNKHFIRQKLMAEYSKIMTIPSIWLNHIGGNDDIIFDGRSFVTNSKGDIVLELNAFQEDQKVIDLEKISLIKKKNFSNPSSKHTLESIKNAILLGTKDYLKKCGKRKIVIGLSGGIDSAITTTLAAFSLKPSDILVIFMPSKYTSERSFHDSQTLSQRLGVQLKIIPITPLMNEFQSIFNQHFSNQDKGVTEENIQARIRSNILMAFSNKENRLLLTTGNKSELSLGYCTLYGDMSGALSIIGDLSKTLIYALAKHLNRDKEWIPQSILLRDPTAELKPNQKDSDTLPEYPLLDPILEDHIEKGLCLEDIRKKRGNAIPIEPILKTIHKNEYKRLQMPITLKITSKCFGPGRKFPIASNYSATTKKSIHCL